MNVRQRRRKSSSPAALGAADEGSTESGQSRPAPSRRASSSSWVISPSRCAQRFRTGRAPPSAPDRSPRTAAIGPPSEAPNSAARSDPAASITARTSSIRSSRVGNRSPARGRRGRCRACRRGSAGRTTRAAAEMRASSGSSQANSRWEIQPGTKTRSIGPSPTTW